MTQSVQIDSSSCRSAADCCGCCSGCRRREVLHSPLYHGRSREQAQAGSELRRPGGSGGGFKPTTDNGACASWTRAHSKIKQTDVSLGIPLRQPTIDSRERRQRAASLPCLCNLHSRQEIPDLRFLFLFILLFRGTGRSSSATRVSHRPPKRPQVGDGRRVTCAWISRG